MSSLITPSLENALSKAVNAEVLRELTVTAIALERYRLKNARPAPNLQALVPQYLAELPRDYWAAGPLTYRPVEPDGFLLYSIGPDGRDDGGDPQPVRGSSKNFAITQGRDLVWPEPATAAEAAAHLAPSSSRTLPGTRTSRPR